MEDSNRIGDDPEETLLHIQRAFSVGALEEIFQAFIDLRREPSAAFFEAVGSVIGKSPNEIRRWIARTAKRSRSNFLSNHLPQGE